MKTEVSAGSLETFIRGAFSKYCWNLRASRVADITTILRSLRLCMIWTREREREREWERERQRVV